MCREWRPTLIMSALHAMALCHTGQGLREFVFDNLPIPGGITEYTVRDDTQIDSDGGLQAVEHADISAFDSAESDHERKVYGHDEDTEQQECVCIGYGDTANEQVPYRGGERRAD